MTSSDIDSRLAAIEERLARLERSAPAPEMPKSPRPVASAAPSWPMPPASRPAAPARARGSVDPGAFVGHALGWGGAVALVLAAAYFIRLAIDAGWLTPAIQVACAGLLGLALIGAGFAMREGDRRYAGLLPAAGIAILFLCIYGAHLYYHLIGVGAAIAAVAAICLLSLGLCAVFDSELYSLFAVIGSYSAPFLIHGMPGEVLDLAVYFSAWSITFSLFAILRRQRLIYLVALYAALIGFDALVRPDTNAWLALLGFQTAQFLIFGTAAVLFTLRARAPMDESTAALHLPALLLFYALQYMVLRLHMPGSAPWVAIGSLMIVAGLHLVVRTVLGRTSPGGQLLLWSYAGLVLFHAGYLENAPAETAPWIAAACVVAALGVVSRGRAAAAPLWPLGVAIAAMFALNLLRVLFDADLQGVPGRAFVGGVYALLLYAGYGFAKGNLGRHGAEGALLYAGHLTAMVVAVHLLHERILESVTWGLLALGCLWLSRRWSDRVLSQSSLLVFGATAAKVMLYDLAGASPLVRVASLVVLGITFYVGGLLYQRIVDVDGATPSAAGRPS